MPIRRDRVESGEPPASLLRFRVADWGDAGEPPAWWLVEGRTALDWRIHNAAREWSRARRAWAREHCRSLGELNRLYAPDVVFPPECDPRVDYRLTVATHSTIRAE